MACYFCSESGSCPAGRSAASAQVQCVSADPGTPVCRPRGSAQRRQVSPCNRPRLGVSASECETHRGHPSSSGRCGAQMPEGSLGDARSRGPGEQGSRNILGGPQRAAGPRANGSSTDGRGPRLSMRRRLGRRARVLRYDLRTACHETTFSVKIAGPRRTPLGLRRPTPVTRPPVRISWNVEAPRAGAGASHVSVAHVARVPGPR